MTTATENITSIGMGKIGAAAGPGCFRAILGSCIGLSLYDPAGKAGAFAHIVLPDSGGRPGMPGKYADTAVAEMLRLMMAYGSKPAALAAKMAGGANMFANQGPMKIGEENTTAIKRALHAAGIRLVAQDTGGTKGRRVTFDCHNGDFLVEIMGQTPKYI